MKMERWRFWRPHYYGGIKKYQWAAIPLALHGTVVKKDGSTVEIAVGEQPGDPVFGISDLLIHLSSEQLQKKAAVVVEGENLNVIVGSRPLKDTEEKEKIREALLGILKSSMESKRKTSCRRNWRRYRQGRPGTLDWTGA